MKNIAHADFIHRPAPTFAQYAAMLVLAVIAAPMLAQLSYMMMGIFALFWCVRIVLLFHQ